MKVNEVCSQGTVHIPMSCNLQEASVQMRDQHVGALIATGDGAMPRVAGVVTDRDIVLKAVTLGASPGDMLVSDVMTPQVAAIGFDADLADAMQMMASHGVRRLAVTDDDGQIVGVLSLDDVIEALGRDLALLASIVRYGQNRESLGSVQAPLHG